MSALLREAERLTPQAGVAGSALKHLPLVTFYLSERCNSRCVTCDYWRNGRDDMSFEQVERSLPALARLQTEMVLISGGEPLLNARWADIAALLRAHGLKLWLLTSGLSLAKHASRVAELFDAVTVSLDGTTASTYEAIRGLDAFDVVCTGIRAASRAGLPVSVRVTLQRANYTELPRFVELARQMGARQVSFLAVDVANLHAFARVDTPRPQDAALLPADLPVIEQLVGTLERDCADDFRSEFIAESAAKLRRIVQYFAAVCGSADFPPVRCNAPEFSAVIHANGRVSPCFFIPGPPNAALNEPVDTTLNREDARVQRTAIRAGGYAECKRCVCSAWRDPQ